MKKLSCFLAVLLLGLSFLRAEEFTTGGVFVNSASTNLSYNLIGKHTNVLQQLIVGKTYHLASDLMEVKTVTGQRAALAFSTGLQVGIAPDSTFSVDSFNQNVKNDVLNPEELQADYAITTLSLLDGEVELICPKMDTNSQCILQTPFVNVNLAEGRLCIKSNPKYVMISAIEGSVTVVDSKNKKSVIDKGQLGLIIPYPGRDGEIMVTTKAISPEELDKTTKSLNTLALHSKDVLFIVLDKRIVGVRLK